MSAPDPALVHANTRQQVALQCPCGKRLIVKSEYVGKRLKCPACGKSTILRGMSSPQAQAVCSQIKDGPDGLSKTTLIVLWSGVAVFAIVAIQLVVWSSQASHAANIVSANQRISEAIENARQWIASNTQDAGETVERQLTESLASELATEKTEGETMLKQVRQRRTKLSEMVRTQGLQRKASAVLDKAKRQIDGKEGTEAITSLREYLADPYATSKVEAQRLLAEAEIAVSDTLTIDSLVTLNDTAFNRAKDNGTIDDRKVAYPGLLAIRQETIQRNLDKARQRRQVLKAEEEKKRDAEQLAVLDRQRLQKEQEEERLAEENRLQQAGEARRKEMKRPKDGSQMFGEIVANPERYAGHHFFIKGMYYSDKLEREANFNCFSIQFIVVEGNKGAVSGLRADRLSFIVSEKLGEPLMRLRGSRNEYLEAVAHVKITFLDPDNKRYPVGYVKQLDLYRFHPKAHEEYLFITMYDDGSFKSHPDPYEREPNK